MKLIGLADCNSFYASCEKAFRPDLSDKPVVVLSNNDGCIVALSKEAKDLGITRGLPYFKVKHELMEKKVSVFSSNYTLYQNISDRIMDFLKSQTTSIEIYSIDEAFFHIPETDIDSASAFAARLHRNIRKCTGMPVSIGMARTKTLAKIANHYAKKHSMSFVLSPENEKDILQNTPIDDIWGIGYRSLPKLQAYGVKTALDFSLCEDIWIQKNFSITGLETAKELRGIPCIEEENPVRHSFTSSISFEKPTSDFAQISEAVACHCSVVCEKLWKSHCKAEEIAVQLITEHFRETGLYDIGCGHLTRPTCYTPFMLNYAQEIAKKVFKKDSKYRSVRITAWNLTSFSGIQPDLFTDSSVYEKEDALSEIIYTTGKKLISCASAGSKNKNGLAKFRFLSPCYTTRWTDLPVAGRSDLKVALEFQ